MTTNFKIATSSNATVDLDDVLMRREYLNVGTLWTWGQATAGKLGDGTTVSKQSPVTVSGGALIWKDVAGAEGHGMGIKNDGTLWTWGTNTFGQLGDGSNTSKSSPGTTAGGGSNWRKLGLITGGGGGRSGAGIKADGTLWTWGSNANGQLGDGTTISKISPVVTSGGANWKQVSCAYAFSGAIKTDGTLWIWGGASFSSAAYLAGSTSSPTTIVGGGTSWKLVSCGYDHITTIKTDNTVWACGTNDLGQFGDGTTINKSSPVTTSGSGTNWKQVSSGRKYTSATKTDGTLWSWGRNNSGQLGVGNTLNRSSPTTISGGGTTWRQVSCGYNQTAAVKADGSLWTWGNDFAGALGDNNTVNRSSPVTVAGTNVNWKTVVACNYSMHGIVDITF
ncbi:Regulator of chromosome condensation (RCC1) repeat [uncultured Caudovirales phage]|uniref:Regulator of chromosome condensation (RCC1) repeat n=1 Tax=uncultured Caudovirales phage TaxID=2100421 RepID=A0A6J5KPT9_9CAUD|nr:Regulator of chromosome condensation (RCC1) repeat [uncultured Caudovirales phage]